MGLFPAHLKLEHLNAATLPPLERSLGIELREIGDQGLIAECVVDERFLQPHGIMHGGISCVIGESLGSIAGNLLLHGSDQIAVGQSLNALHIRSAMPGTRLRAAATPLHVGRRSQIWEINIKDKETEKAICKVTLTLAVIDRRAP